MKVEIINTTPEKIQQELFYRSISCAGQQGRSAAEPFSSGWLIHH